MLLALKSPRFLYLGLEDTKPDDFTVAERLSFGLWDSLPDQELIKTATDKTISIERDASGKDVFCHENSWWPFHCSIVAPDGPAREVLGSAHL